MGPMGQEGFWQKLDLKHLEAEDQHHKMILKVRVGHPDCQRTVHLHVFQVMFSESLEDRILLDCILGNIP